MEFKQVKQEINNLEHFERLDELTNVGLEKLSELRRLLSERSEAIDILDRMLNNWRDDNLKPLNIIAFMAEAEQLIKSATEL